MNQGFDEKRLAPFIESVNQIDGLTAKVVQDGAGRDIYRANVHVSGNHTAKEVIAELKKNRRLFIRENIKPIMALSNLISVLWMQKKWL